MGSNLPNGRKGNQRPLREVLTKLVTKYREFRNEILACCRKSELSTQIGDLVAQIDGGDFEKIRKEDEMVRTIVLESTRERFLASASPSPPK